MIRIVIFTLISVICFFLGAENSEQSEIIRLSKENFIRLFIENSDMVKSFKYDIEETKAEKQIATAGNFPRLNFVVGAGPHPKYIYHPNKLENINGEYDIIKETWEKHPYNISEYGVAIRANAELSIPIYTISKNINLYKYHSSKINTLKSEKNFKIISIRKEAALHYWSWIRLNENLKLTKHVLSELNDVEKKMRKKLYNEDTDIKQKDLIKLRIKKTNLEHEAETLSLQINSLKTLIDQSINFQKWHLTDSITDLPSYTDISKSSLSFPTFDIQIKKAQALKHLVNMEQARFIPDIHISTNFSWKYTSSVNEKDYPHPESPYNDVSSSFFLNFTFDQNYFEMYRKIQKIKFRLESEKAKISFNNHLKSLILKKKINNLKSLKSKVDHLKVSRTILIDQLSKNRNDLKSLNDLTENLFLYLQIEKEISDASFEYMLKIEEIYVLAKNKNYFE